MFCSAYLDKILINPDTLEEHITHFTNLLTNLSVNDVLLKSEKWEFHTETTIYLGLILSPEGIGMDHAKVKAVLEWNTPDDVKDI